MYIKELSHKELEKLKTAKMIVTEMIEELEFKLNYEDVEKQVNKNFRDKKDSESYSDYWLEKNTLIIKNVQIKMKKFWKENNCEENNLQDWEKDTLIKNKINHGVAGRNWFKKRAMIVRDWLMDLYREE